MCGRYALNAEPDVLQKRFGLKKIPVDYTKVNVTPGSMMPVILSENPTCAVLAKWGYVPYWAKDPKIGYKMINARSETLLEKPAFKKSFLSQRCIIPATGFYEWFRTETEKVPYYFYLSRMNVFAFAGLYDRWRDVENRELLTFTIITTQPNSIVSRIHNRMPVILGENTESSWLDNKLTDFSVLQSFLGSYSAQNMELKPVLKNDLIPSPN